MQTRRRYAQAFFGLLFAQEALAVPFSAFHAWRIRFYGSSVQQTARDSILEFLPNLSSQAGHERSWAKNPMIHYRPPDGLRMKGSPR
jgi:hypothetical protein